MKILGIETSCDETAASIVEDGNKILSNVVVSQIDIFAAYGGVIPEVAARSHLEAILPVVDKALDDAKLNWDNIDAIAVTHTPGLLGSLLIGTLTARTLAILHKKPLYPIHHLKSHIYANWLSDISLPFPNSSFSEHVSSPLIPSFPLLALVISGGHTQILYMKKHNDFEIIGTTLDDAVGECFDKVAKILGLPYPGGPSIAKATESGDREKYHFPHPKTENPLDFSFSGLKTAVLRTVQKELGLPISYPSHDLKNHLNDQQVADFAASFEKTAIDILLEKLALALEKHPETKSLVFAGGVSANQFLRKTALKTFKNTSFLKPSLRSKDLSNLFLNVSAGADGQNDNVSPTEPSNRRTKRVDDRGEVLAEHCDFDIARRGPSEEKLVGEVKEKAVKIFFPDLSLSGDNGAMVASAAFYEIKSGVSPTDPYSLDIFPRSPIK